MDMSLNKLWEIVKDREACTVVPRVAKSWTTERLNNKILTQRSLLRVPSKDPDFRQERH